MPSSKPPAGSLRTPTTLSPSSSGPCASPCTRLKSSHPPCLSRCFLEACCACWTSKALPLYSPLLSCVTHISLFFLFLYYKTAMSDDAIWVDGDVLSIWCDSIAALMLLAVHCLAICNWPIVLKSGNSTNILYNSQVLVQGCNMGSKEWIRQNKLNWKLCKIYKIEFLKI